MTRPAWTSLLTCPDDYHVIFFHFVTYSSQSNNPKSRRTKTGKKLCERLQADIRRETANMAAITNHGLILRIPKADNPVESTVSLDAIIPQV
jgi:hypothetical protein